MREPNEQEVRELAEKILSAGDEWDHDPENQSEAYRWEYIAREIMRAGWWKDAPAPVRPGLIIITDDSPEVQNGK